MSIRIGMVLKDAAGLEVEVLKVLRGFIVGLIDNKPYDPVVRIYNFNGVCIDDTFKPPPLIMKTEAKIWIIPVSDCPDNVFDIAACTEADAKKIAAGYQMSPDEIIEITYMHPLYPKML